MADSIVRVIVSEDESGQGFTSTNTSTLQPATNQVQEPKAQKSMSIQTSRVLAGAYSTLKTVSSQILSNVGTYTGDNLLQTKINNIQQATSTGIMLAINPIAGLTNIAINVGSTIWQEEFRKKQESISLSVSRAKAGYTDTASILISRRH